MVAHGHRHPGAASAMVGTGSADQGRSPARSPRAGRARAPSGAPRPRGARGPPRGSRRRSRRPPASSPRPRGRRRAARRPPRSPSPAGPCRGPPGSKIIICPRRGATATRSPELLQVGRRPRAGGHDQQVAPGPQLPERRGGPALDREPAEEGGRGARGAHHLDLRQPQGLHPGAVGRDGLGPLARQPARLAPGQPLAARLRGPALRCAAAPPRGARARSRARARGCATRARAPARAACAASRGRGCPRPPTTRRRGRRPDRSPSPAPRPPPARGRTPRRRRPPPARSPWGRSRPQGGGDPGDAGQLDRLAREGGHLDDRAAVGRRGAGLARVEVAQAEHLFLGQRRERRRAPRPAGSGAPARARAASSASRRGSPLGGRGWTRLSTTPSEREAVLAQPRARGRWPGPAGRPPGPPRRGTPESADRSSSRTACARSANPGTCRRSPPGSR